MSERDSGDEDMKFAAALDKVNEPAGLVAGPEDVAMVADAGAELRQQALHEVVLEQRRAKIRSEELRQAGQRARQELQREYLGRLLKLTIGWLIFTAAVVVFELLLGGLASEDISGASSGAAETLRWELGLPTSVMLALLGTTLTTVIGLFGTAIIWLYRAESTQGPPAEDDA